jgi:diguanylate cyclase (GGDEF)-like protein
MNTDTARHDATPAQLVAIIATQTEIAKLGLDLGGVMTMVAERALEITRATGAVVELVEGDETVCRAAAGAASEMLGVRLKRDAGLSGLCGGRPSMVVVPLVHDGGEFGALKVFSPEVAAFGDGDARALALMSGLIADRLTGLANRALFMDRLRHAIASSYRTQRRFAVLMLDMDGLTPINDTHGHRAGDAALQEIARRIASELRQSDTVARFGGDEFAYLLSTVPDRESAHVVVQRIARRCNQPFEFAGETLQLGASIGIAIGPDDGDEPEALLELADRDMYAAKRRKKLVTRA